MLNIGKVNDGKPRPREGHIEGDYGHLLPRPRPTVTTGFTEKVKIGCGNLYITVNYDEHGICEVFTNTGRAGGCPSQSEATARLVSVAIRSGMDPKEIIQQMKGIRCPSCLRQPGVPVTSCPDAIAKALEKVMGDPERKRHNPRSRGLEKVKQNISPAEAKLAKFCPECGSKLEHEGGLRHLPQLRILQVRIKFSKKRRRAFLRHSPCARARLSGAPTLGAERCFSTRMSRKNRFYRRATGMRRNGRILGGSTATGRGLRPLPFVVWYKKILSRGESMAGKQRIQLIDALRGLAVGLMVIHHFLYDLVAFCGAPGWLFSNPVFTFCTLSLPGSSLSLRGQFQLLPEQCEAGLKALACALVITAVTVVMDMPILFGVLHLLGTCMVLYGLTRPLWERLPFWAVPAFPLGLVLTGHMVGGVPSESRWLWMLGWTYEGFVSTDYFPLLPWVFVFLLGTWAGKYIKAGRMPAGSMGRTARPWRRWAATVSSSMSSTSRCSTASPWPGSGSSGGKEGELLW